VNHQPVRRTAEVAVATVTVFFNEAPGDFVLEAGNADFDHNIGLKKNVSLPLLFTLFPMLFRVMEIFTPAV
jgi:hypothetical protein